MAEIARAYVQLIPSFKGLKKTLDEELGDALPPGDEPGKKWGSQYVAAIGGRVSSAGRTLTRSMSMPIAAAGTAMLKMGGDFEAGMNKVKAVSGATGKDFEMLRDQAKQLGSSTKFSASEAADAMSFLAMAGFKAKDIYGAMPSTLNLAAAANLDLGNAADITSNILTGYQMKVEDLSHANDVLVKAFTSANVDLTQLGESFKYAGPVAKAAGMSFEDAAATIGLLGNAGIQGSMAGTTLRGALSRLMNPTKEASKRLEDLGVKTKDSSGKLRPFTDIVADLGDKGATAADLLEIFGDRAGPGMQALIDQGAPAIRKLSDELKNSGGTADRVAKTQMEGFKGSMTELKSAFEGLMIALSDSGALAAVTDLVKSFTKVLQNLAGEDPGKLRAIVKALLAFATVGPALSVAGKGITGTISAINGFKTAAKGIKAAPATFKKAGGAVSKFVKESKALSTVSKAAKSVGSSFSGLLFSASGLGGAARGVKSFGTATTSAVQNSKAMTATSAAFKKAGGAVTGFVKNSRLLSAAGKAIGVAMTAMTGPIGIAVAAIAAIGFGLYEAYKHSETFRNAVDTLWANVKEWTKGAVDAIKEWAIPIWDVIKEAASKAWDKLKEIIPPLLERLQKLFGKAKEAGVALWEGIKTAWDTFGQPVVDFVRAHWGEISEFLTTTWNSLVDTFGGVFSGIADTLSGVFETITGIFHIFSSLFKGDWDGVWNGIKETFGGVWDTIQGIFKTAWEAITGVANTVLGPFKDLFSGAWEGIKSTASNAWEGIKGTVSEKWESLKSGAQNFADTVSNKVSTGWEKVKTGASSAWENVKGTVSSSWENIKASASQGASTIGSRVSSAWSRIKSSSSSTWGSVTTSVSNAWGRMKGSIGAGIGNAVEQMRGMPSRILSALGNIGEYLFNSGKSLLSGFVKGIKNGISNAVTTVKNGLKEIRSFFPFSPAKNGPFSGKGWVLYSGISVMNAMAEGMDRGAGGAVRAARQAMARTRAELQVSAAVGGRPRRQDWELADTTDEATQASRGGVTVVQHINAAQVPKDSDLASKAAEQARLIGVLV